MKEFNNFMTTFTSGNLFVIFIAIMIIILVVLIIALFKMKNSYNVNYNIENNDSDDKDILGDIISDCKSDTIEPMKTLKETPIIVPVVTTYDNVVDEYEASEEEQAVISTEELEKKTKERMEALGLTDNQAMIQKYEDEQEKKAIISYEQLLKNASNITVTYKEEKTESGAPKVNKIEVKEHFVDPVDTYVSEEEFLRMLKDFRVKLE